MSIPEAFATASTDNPKHDQSKRNTLLFLLIVGFLNTMGVSIFAPVMPFIVQRYVADPGQLAMIVGWLSSVYAFCQFLAAPALGTLSDRYGRRPLLLFCMFGSAIGYALFGFGGALWILFLGRIIDGVTGGNFSILSAYIGDISALEERGEYFGRFGAVAGAGFIVGPAIGGFVSRFGPSAPVYVAAVMTTLSLVWGYFFLPESLRDEHRAMHISLKEFNLFKQFRDTFAIPQLRWLLLATFALRCHLQ